MVRILHSDRHPLCALLAVATLTLLAVAIAPAALARNVYVTSFESNAVSVIDSQTKQVVGLPIPVGDGPGPIAITPDGRRAYVANSKSNNVTVIDTTTNQPLGPPIAVGETPATIAISPDGRRAYVVNGGSGSVSVIDTQSNQLVGPSILVGLGPLGAAITPDGKRVFVSLAAADSVVAIDTQTAQLAGSPIPVDPFPGPIAISPDGKLVYVTSLGSKSVLVIDTQTNQLTGPPIPLPNTPQEIKITPDGRSIYVVGGNPRGITVIDAQTRQLGPPVVGVVDQESLAIAPDGRTGYAGGGAGNNVLTLDLQANQLGAPIALGSPPGPIAITPDQSPLVSISAAPRLRLRPGAPVAFDGTASGDSDGTIAAFAWSFGDGASATGPTASHGFAKPGTYRVTLTATDNEGCSTTLVFTGQTAYCSGSAPASVDLTVANPGVRLRCPGKARPRGCKFRLQAVTKKRRGKPQSAVAGAKVKAGRSAILTLKPKARFRTRLFKAKKVLVKETASIDGVTRTRFARLKIVQ